MATNIQAEKIELVKRLLDIDDEATLQQVKEVFERHEKDFLTDLPEYVKAGIIKAQKQAEQGLFTPHEEVTKRHVKYL